MTKGWLLQTSLHNWSNVAPPQKKLCKHSLWEEDFVKLAYMVELLSRNHCWGSKTISKGSSGPRHIKTRQESVGIKSFRRTDQSSKSLIQIGGSVWWRVGERAALPSITPAVKHRGGSVTELEAWIIPAITAYAASRDPIYPTPPLGQDMTQGQFLKRSLAGLNSEFSFS